MRPIRDLFLRGADRFVEYTRRWELANGPREVVHGVTVVAFRDEAAGEVALLDKVRAALELIARHDPDSLQGIRDHFDHVQVVYTLGIYAAECRAAERLCLLGGDYLAEEGTTPEAVAMVLVHELTHARHLARPGGRELSVPQAEWLCIGAELAFIRGVPGTERLQRDAEQRLERRPDFYGPEARRERARRLLHEQVPRPLTWLLERLAGAGSGGRSEPEPDGL